MDLSLLKKTLDSLKLPDFRYRQIVKNYYSGRYLNFDQMTDLSLDLRQKLSESQTLLSVSEKTIIGDESTQKALLELVDGQKIESVLIPVDDKNRFTVCVSSQAGCSLTCTFCATGRMGLIRQLTTAEIFDQYIEVNKIALETYGQALTNVVYMSMG